MATTTLLGLTLTLSPTALTALRIAPLLSSTASLTHAYMEWVTTSSFLGPAPVDSALSRFLRGPSAEPKATRQRPPAAEGLDAELEQAKELVVPQWFVKFFNTGVVSVIGFNSLTLLSASLNLAFPGGLGGSRTFYVAGLATAVAHYGFVPLVGGSVRALFGMAAEKGSGEAETSTGKKAGGLEGEGKAVESVREWIGWHKVRMGTVDGVAWGCFAWAAVGAVGAATM